MLFSSTYRFSSLWSCPMVYGSYFNLLILAFNTIRFVNLLIYEGILLIPVELKFSYFKDYKESKHYGKAFNGHSARLRLLRFVNFLNSSGSYLMIFPLKFIFSINLRLSIFLGTTANPFIFKSSYFLIARLSNTSTLAAFINCFYSYV